MNKSATLLLLGACLAFSTSADAARYPCRWWWQKYCGVTGTNTAPTISGTPATSVATGQSYAFTPVARDAEGNPLTFSIVNRPAWASFSSSTGRLTGTPTAASVGEYQNIRISVSDGRLSSALAPFSVTVLQGNRAPVISGTPPATAREGQAYAFLPAASDPDGDPVSFSIVNRPGWASFDSLTGALTGTPGAGTVGSYGGITIRVSDGVASASLPAFSIAVQQVATGSATLSWRAPTTRTDGSALTNLVGYRVRYGTASGSYPNLVTIPNGGLTSAVIENLPPATWYFVVSAYDAAGAESAYTSPVSKTIQ